MGCHTWFYTKVENINYTEKEIIDIYVKQLEFELNNLHDFYDSDEQIKFKERVLNKQIQKVKDGKVNCAVFERVILNYNDEELYYYRNIGWYIDNEKYHDVFRIGNYPSDILTSFEQTMDFINKNKNKINFSTNYKEKLKQYWIENPNGLIEFI
jgi:preprotein translocase subunit SecB